jgi:peptidoglycan/LPS O-acetylase OafA/YrhL
MINQSNKHLNFITGLRGLAILLVLLYHFEFPMFSNGFLGVDLFFWISGYLLFRGFIREYEENRQNSRGRRGWIDVRFYFIRRFRRIVPLTVICLSSYLLIVSFFNGIDYAKTLNKQILGILTFTYNTSLSASNVNYFDALAVDTGLLHFWSLAVEEQIYVILPFAFLAATGMNGFALFGKHFDWRSRILFLMSSLSLFSYSLIPLADKLGLSYDFIFYSAFTRFWEFGLGALVAILESMKIADSINKSYLRIAGIVSQIVFFYFLFFIPIERFDWTVLVLITALSVFYLETDNMVANSLFGKILRLRVFQILGNIAFPLYLIHWPVVSELIKVEILSIPIFQIIGVLSSIGMALIVSKFVEQPILKIDLTSFKRDAPKTHRSRRARNSRNSISSYLTAAYLVLLLFITDPNQFRYQVDYAKNFLINSTIPAELDKPFTTQPIPKANEDSRSVSVKEEGTQVLDTPKAKVEAGNENESSSLSRFVSAWNATLYKAGTLKTLPSGYKFSQVELVQEQNKAWNSGCLNSGPRKNPCSYGAGTKTAIVVGDSYAFALVPGLRDALSADWKVIVLTRGLCLPWFGENYFTDGREDLDCESHNQWVKNQVEIIKPDLLILSAADKIVAGRSISSWTNSFVTTIESYKKHTDRIAVVPVVPGAGNLNTCLRENGNIEACYGESGPSSKFASVQIENSRTKDYTVLDLTRFLCNGAYCPPIIDGIPVYVDGNHLTSHFSKKLAVVFKYLGIE